MENGNKPATQADLQAVKSDLKADISRLDKKIDGVAIEMFKRFDATASKTDVAAISQQLDKITGLLDTLSGEIKDNRRTLIVYDEILGKHRRTLESHEKRLTDLEAKP